MKNLITLPAVAIFVLLSLAGLPRAIAQPRITKQPMSIAVALEGSATLQVTASAPTPLTFQWQFNGADLTGAISNRLTLTNVALADLGVYRVIVRDGSNEAASQPAWLKLARWTEMIVFGSSHCMTSATNGRSWVEWLQELLGFSSARIKNYASGGAQLLDVRSQIQQYLRAFTPQTNTLLAPFWVYENLPNQLAVEQYVSNYVVNISLLANAGGRVFLLATPAPLNWASTNAEVWTLDQLLHTQFDAAVDKLQADFGLTVFRFDFHESLMRIWNDPTAYGITNLTGTANTNPKGDPNRYFWWDSQHTTTAVHRLSAQEMYRCLTPPLAIARQTRDPSGVVELQWQGGSPPFRLQRCSELATGAWQSGELSFATNATIMSTTPQQYFRVLQLGQ